MITEQFNYKMQELFGNKYKFYNANNFSRSYTNTEDENINLQPFTDNKQVIALTNLAQSRYGVTEYLSYNTTYTIDFIYPLDNVKFDENGIILNDNEIVDIYADCIRVKNELNTQLINFDNLFARMTFSEPTVQNTTIKASNGVYGQIKITGTINFTDKGSMASYRRLYIKITDQWKEITNFNNRSSGYERQFGVTQKAGAIYPSAKFSGTSHTIAFQVDCNIDNADTVNQLFQDIGDGFLPNNLEFEFKIERGLKAVEFKAYLSVNISAPSGSSGLEYMDIVITRKE